MMYRVPFEEFAEHKARTGQHHPLRQKGKIGELAFGYGGWLGAAAAFGMPGSDDEIKDDILAWRRASPAVEWLWGGQTRGAAGRVVRNALLPGYAGTVDDRLHWLRAAKQWDDETYYYGVEGMAMQALLAPGTWNDVARLDGTSAGIAFLYRGNVLYCRLPSARVITYRNPQWETSDRGGYALSYEGANTNPKNGPVGWIRMRTWGSRLVENINQGTCRDILAPACIALEARQYPVVLHVYDEIVSEIPVDFGSTDEYEQIVTVPPAWAHDWPIRAPGTWREPRYGKR
jgi:DNA polymerase bacteriophage-type